MDIITIVIATTTLLCIAVCWSALRRDKPDATPRPKNIAVRDSAAVALSFYWSHYYDGWSLVQFRDVFGIIRHVACEVPDGRYFDASGYCDAEQIAKRLGMLVKAENCDEADVQSLMGTNNAVLEAADDFRSGVERKA